MNPVIALLWSLARAFVAYALGYLVAKGWVTADQAQQASPELVSYVVGAVTILGLALHSLWQKYRAGVIAPSSSSTTSTPTKNS